ncbi:MAG TPA: acyl-CoA dehydrogenase family protein [Candidatus Solibacter sp.]|nr:acyl-CoA dehydrogenase family protein [Candidatus Solibacter sp.]
MSQATLKTPVTSGSFLFADQGPDEIFTKEDVSEEQQLFARTAEQFMRDEVVPLAEQLYTKDWSITRKLLRQAGELDLLRADVPEQYGGLGLDKVSSALISEQMALNASFAATVSAHTGIGTLPIVYFGTPEQRAKYLPRIASGEMVSAFCLTEPGSGSDALAAKTKATLSGDGKHYILSGQKMWITNGGLADVFIVFAKVDGEKFTAFIVERGPGVTSGHDEKKLGLDGSSTTAITFEDCRVPVENVLGQVGKGHVVAFNTLNFGRLKLGNRNIGLAKIALNNAISYANERHQFGRAIASFGLIKRKLADMAVRCYVGDAVTFRTVGMVDRALEAVDQNEPMQVMKVIEQFAVECSIIKVWTSETLGYVADESLQTYGGYGYSKDYPAERIVRDARITRIYEGTNEINRMLVTTRLLRSAAEGSLEAAFQNTLKAVNGSGRPAGSNNISLVESKVVEGKRTAIAALHAITHSFGEELKEQQEVLALVADILIDLYTMESVWLRTRKLKATQAEEKSRVPHDIATLYACEASDRIAVNARNLAGVLAGRNAASEVSECAQRLFAHAPIDTVALRQNVADTLISAGKYVW